jgi:hypothetical protein
MLKEVLPTITQPAEIIRGMIPVHAVLQAITTTKVEKLAVSAGLIPRRLTSSEFTVNK